MSALRRIPSEHELLTPKDREDFFVAEYLKDFDGPRAWRAAGFAADEAVRGSIRLLQDSNIKATLKRRISVILQKASISPEDIIKSFATISNANMADYMVIGADGFPRWDFSVVTREQMGSVQELTVQSTVEGVNKVTDPDSGEVVEVPREVKQVKLKLYNKMEAMTNLAKLMQMYNGSDPGNEQTIIIEGGLPPALPAPNAQDNPG